MFSLSILDLMMKAKGYAACCYFSMLWSCFFSQWRQSRDFLVALCMIFINISAYDLIQYSSQVLARMVKPKNFNTEEFFK